jgi:hypothetical protein
VFVRPVWHGSPNSPSTEAELTQLREENDSLKGRLDVIEAALAKLPAGGALAAK